MSYELQNFTSGEVLFASRLNNMDIALKNAFEEQDTKRDNLLNTLTPNDLVETNKYVASVKIENGKIKTDKVELPDFVLVETHNQVATKVSDIENQLGVINGEGEGSIKKLISDNIAQIIAQAPEDFDTLKEIADWIVSDTTNSTQLISRVTANETSIAEAKGRLSNLESLATLLTNSVNDAKNSISTLNTEYKQADETLKSDLTESIELCKSDCLGYTDSKIGALNTVYDAKGSANTAEQNAKKYTDEEILKINIETYATKSWVSEQDYLTEHLSLEEYIKASEVYKKEDVHNKTEVNTLLLNYALQSALNEALTLIAALEVRIAALEEVKEPVEPDQPENPTDEPIE